MSQLVLTTNQYLIFNHFQWRYLLMFVKFIFCINRTKFYYFFKSKIWLWTYASQKCLVNFETISGDETLIIWIKSNSLDTPKIILEQNFFEGDLWYSLFQNFVEWTAPVVHQPEMSLYTNKFFTVLGYTFSCFLGMLLFRICKFMIITFVQDAYNILS